MAKLGEDITQKLGELVDTQQRTDTPQQRFDLNYITAQEIMDRLDVTRPTVLTKMKGRFPAIKIGNTYFWERSLECSNFIDAWELMRNKGE